MQSYGINTNRYALDDGISHGVREFIFYFIIIIIILLILLIIFHYTVRRIFKLRPGETGIISLPGSDDSKLVWKSEKNLTTLTDAEVGLQSFTGNWSMMLDIQLDNPMANTNIPRILFARGPINAIKTDVTTFTNIDTITKLIPQFNLVIYLDRLTNDLFVSVLTKGDSQPFLESGMISNIPAGKSIRLGIMVGSHVIEIYLNGLLVKTKSYVRDLFPATGYIYPPSQTILGSTARVRNLRVWKRPLSPAEFRAYGKPDDLNVKVTGDSCVSLDEAQKTIDTSLERIQSTAESIEDKTSRIADVLQS